MNSLLLALLAVVVLLNGALLIVLWRRQRDRGVTEHSAMQMLNTNVQGMQGRLDHISQGLNERLDQAARVIGEVNRELGTMQEIGRGMRSLQELLQSPKLRGNIGEHVLHQMLEQAFPLQLYALQYKFRDGQIVDAIIKTDDGFIPIDAKFPLENYQRATREEREDARLLALREFVKDVKKHVDVIAKKYILPDEGTVDFAIMYIPSEAVYYEVIRDEFDLNSYALGRKILFVSPNSFYYFLRVIMMGMQGKKMADATREVIASIHGIQKDTERFGETLGVLTSHITHSKSTIDRAASEFSKLSGKIEQLDQIEERSHLKEISDDSIAQ